MYKRWLLILAFSIGIASTLGLLIIALVPKTPKSNQQSAITKITQQVIHSPTATPTITPFPTLPPIPSQKVLAGGNQVFQTFNNCGPAALSMTLSHYGILVSQQQLGQEMRPYQQARGDNDDKSVTLDEVEAKAKQYGFLVYHRPAASMEIVEQFIANDMPVVTRTWLHPGEDIGHFRVVKGYDKNSQQLLQDDSLQGPNLWYSYAEFDDLWKPFNYEFVVLVPQEKQQIAERILGSELANEPTAWQKSIALANQTLVNNPDDIYATFNKSVALYHTGQYQQSIQLFESVQSRLPFRMLWYQIEPILAYWQVGDTQKVINISDQILNNHNRAYSELYYLKGLVYQKEGNTSQANEMFRQADFYNSTDSWKANLIGINN